ncbi:TNF receptor-associated factor 4 [Oopsacas minuta]|uniref:TNF receptor-associated factor 4 n=1 Tax=Oopsacas minuta TaxID=111878 RepID=A0AAV7JEF7_9METZ|nr:TNF receptor-associated factor 4 [Oopsacas minuta]
MALKGVSNEDATRKTYNTVDSKEQLLWVETSKNTFRGYKQDLLVNALTEIEVEFYVCTECHGVMRNACQIGNEQTPACELCVGEGVPSQVMMKSRQRILELRVKCPLVTRGCKWNGVIADFDWHLDLCQEFVIHCNNCIVKLKRCELENHNYNECLGKRKIECKHCHTVMMYRDIDQHNTVCIEYPVSCPNDCKFNLKRRLLEAHLDTDCPNTIVECPYRKFGCMQEVKRCELERHTVTNQFQHLENKTSFAISRMEQIEKRNAQLEERIEKLSYPVVLRNSINIDFNQLKMNPGLSRHLENCNMNFELYLKFVVKISLSIKPNRNCKTISVTIFMMYDQIRSPLVKWPFEGRFKLTVFDKTNINEPLVYPSSVVKLQPDRKGISQIIYPSEFVLAEIPISFLQDERRRTKNGIPFTLQVQEAGDLLNLMDPMK